MKNVPVLILGATVSGIAMALAIPNQALIIEKTALIGREFIDSMNAKPCRMERDYSSMAQGFRDELISRNLLSHTGAIHVPRISSVLSNRIAESGAEIWMLTEVESIKDCGHGFKVILFNADGHSTIHADRIIDTTSIGILHHRATGISIQKNLCAVLASAEEQDLELTPDEQAVILQGRFDHEYILKLKLEMKGTWPQARARLHDYWQHNQPDGWQIAAIASSFAYDFPETDAGYHIHVIKPNWNWIPSAGYPDLLCAFEGGQHALL